MAPRSTLVVNVDLPLAGLGPTLETKVPRRVAEERDHDIGIAGRLEYTVDRGAFTVRAVNDSIVVEAPLVAHARACAKGSCYASCDPEAKATAVVPLKLGADYKLRTSSVRVDITKGCTVKVAGGFVRIDVTPQIRAGLAQETGRIQAAIDKELPNLKPEATRLWNELGKPRSLPLGSCVVLSPEEITQGPASAAGDLAHLRFGLLARPELRVRCGEAPRAPSLPPLKDDAALTATSDVNLGIVLPPDVAARALEGATLEMASRTQVTKASGDPATGIELDLLGEACGAAGITAGSASWHDTATVSLANVEPIGGDAERFAAANVDVASFVKSIEGIGIALPLAPDALATALPELARGLSDATVSVDARIDESKPATAGLRGSEIVAVVHLRGAMTMRAK
ncbi:hypothetical protein AKJ09_03751 [Labilithrix luteola]|uniref:DUF4403 family protein n=1 Tax=Labilithrix luteola TaxID=1391654 RepID=A0A0K1PU90_9BACT|nr:hypothetical protein AKJ09_03751 [Labilithrix luteola]